MFLCLSLMATPCSTHSEERKVRTWVEGKGKGHLDKGHTSTHYPSQTHLLVPPLGSQQIHQQNDVLLIDEVDGLWTVLEDAAQQVQQFCIRRRGVGL